MINVVSEIIKFDSIGLDKKDWMVFGGAVLTLHGIRETNDLDLYVRPEVYTDLRNSGKYKIITVNSTNGEKEIIKISNDIEIAPTISPLNTKFETVLKKALLCEVCDPCNKKTNFNVIDLNTLIKWKSLVGRKKDLDDIKLIEQYIISIKLRSICGRSNRIKNDFKRIRK